MNVYQTQLEEQVYKIIDPEIRSLGYEAVRIRMMGSMNNKTLQIMIDRLDGAAVTVDDCEAASRQISVILDVEEVVRTHYSLELSSPGINRPLTRAKDFTTYAGEAIKLTTKLPINGQRNFSGKLIAGSEMDMTILPKDSEEEIKIAFSNISDANLQPVLMLKQEKPNLKQRRK